MFIGSSPNSPAFDAGSTYSIDQSSPLQCSRKWGERKKRFCCRDWWASGVRKAVLGRKAWGWWMQSSSSAASPSSSSSAVSATHLGFDSMQHQQQQQQQQQFAFRQAGSIRGVMGGSNFSSPPSSSPMPQQSRKFLDLSQQSGASQFREENQIKGQGGEQHHIQNNQAYLQYAFQAAQQKPYMNMQPQQQGKMGLAGPSGNDQDMRMNNLKMQELMSIQAANHAANKTPGSVLKKSAERFLQGEKQMEQGQTSADQRNELKPPQAVIGQLTAASMIRPPQSQQSHPSLQNISNNQVAMAQLQAVQAWALERNIDLSLPAHANLIAQLLPRWQSRGAAMQKPNENNVAMHPSRIPPPKQQIMSSQPVASDSSAHGNPLGDVTGQDATVKTRPTVSGPSTNANNIQMQQLVAQSQENQTERIARHPLTIGNGMPTMHPPKSSASMSQNADNLHGKSAISGSEAMQMQYFRHLQQLNRTSSQPAVSPSESSGSGSQPPSQGGSTVQAPQQQRIGFTKQQLHVLKAQILAFRRLKRGEGNLPQEVLQAIAPPPLDSQPQQVYLPSGTSNRDRSTGKSAEVHGRNLEVNDKVPHLASLSQGLGIPKEESVVGDEKATSSSHLQGVVVSSAMKEPVRVVSVGKEEQTTITPSVKSEQETERGNPNISSSKGDLSTDRGKAIPLQATVSENAQVKKPTHTSVPPPAKDAAVTRKYYGPLFDFPVFTRRPDLFGSAGISNNTNNLTFAYDVKDLLFEEGMEVLSKKRTESLKKIGGLLAVNLERKRIRPDLVLRLQIEERKLRLLDLQRRLRDEVDQQQQEIMAMSDRPYRKFVRQCERQRMELVRQVQLSQKAVRERQLKSIFQWRKKLLESHWAIRDARTARNRGVAKYHEKMLREFAKRKDEDRSKRMEALKNNDVDRYREMLLEQQTNIPGDASQRYAVLSSFLSQTEEYLNKLGGKITSAKNHQEVEEAANAAAAAARSQGLSEEEVRTAAACAREEVMIRNRFSEMNAPRDNSSVNKYYNLAHAVNERVVRQPSMLRAGTLRDYQLVGLQWMLSLYNNKLNGILADEMGLGKTVQVMALIAYLMEFKGNYGPHLIIVPNAVLVNWKSELHNWLPSASCIFYVGGKDQRSKLFSQEVSAMKFNVLVTTYEFVMYDRSKLSKVDWKYIIIDEAQRMKDRESVLARDLDRYRCQRRLLLTGTPLQNDLKELWSLLNLLLPEVFDNRKAFHDWFSQPFQKDSSSRSAEDDWLETEKKVIIIHRLHQILEPFMLRRRVEDVEGSLPPKVSIVLRCRMSAIQGAIYDWIKSTGTIKVDPDDELRRVEKNPLYQVKLYKNLNNRYRILIKLQRAGHRVLLFSTMTKLLDILEEYLQWRRLAYRRIDGTTSLEDRESAIVDFNSPYSDCFIFLLSIRAAGRGLNLQTADTVVIYDPDPNPQNEEQAVARAHRIGQKREVKVIYLEAVVDKISSYQKEDELRSGGVVDLEDDLAGKDRYMGSIESLIRNNIQQYKIDMADEVINAGRFDQRTTHEERRVTLETLLHDEERYQENVHDVPSLQEVNRMIARSKEEIELFNQMDEDFDWTDEMIKYNQVPKWLRAATREVNATIASLSKKPPKNGMVSNIGVESNEAVLDSSPARTQRKRGWPRGSSSNNKFSIYQELDDENGDESEASSEEGNGFHLQEEEGEIGDYDDEEFSGAVGPAPSTKDQSEDEGPVCDDGGYGFSQTLEATRNDHIFEEAGSSGSSSDESRRLAQTATPATSQKFGSLSALDARPGNLSKKTPDELEEGEIAVSGDSHMDLQQSGSWIHDRDDGEDEQVLQPKIKRKRSIRLRPRHNLERFEEKSCSEKHFRPRGSCSSHVPSHVGHLHEAQLRNESEIGTTFNDAVTTDRHQRHILPSRRATSSAKSNVLQKPNRSNCLPGLAENASEHYRESWDGKTMNLDGPVMFGQKMSEIVQRRCKNVTSKFHRRIDKDGHQIAPVLTECWKSANSGHLADNVLDLCRIDQRVECFEYNGVMDYVADVQLMLKNAVQYCGYSHEVRSEARKLQDVFFDIMKIAFPDTDFREAKHSVSFSGPGGTSQSPKLVASQAKRHKLINEVEQEPRPLPASSDVKLRSQPPKFQKESRLASSSNSRERSGLDEAPWLTPPGDLVICKKKRKDRDKLPVKSNAAPLSPVNMSRSVRGPAKSHQPTQQQSGHPHAWASARQPIQLASDSGSGAVMDAQWAKPVKRMRTDAGKRRPSHL
ncbi:hypothetical protein AAC387_Pa11g0175 [Persea americana]